MIKCIHLMMCRRYRFKNAKRLRTHKVSGVMENEFAKIIIDTSIKTDINTAQNRPDMVVLDKKRNEMKFIGIEITSQEQQSWRSIGSMTYWLRRYQEYTNAKLRLFHM